MISLPVEMVRKASMNITSVVSDLLSDNSKEDFSILRHKNSQLINNAKELYTMSIKRTPSKDAGSITQLSIKSGFMQKRNEQGSWYNKFVCAVPHAFLYYYDSNTSDSPRGIIDLELFTNISVENGVLKLSTSNDEKVKPFFFDHEDQQLLQEWSTVLSRDRFSVIMEEKNMYSSMQAEMSHVIESTTKLKEMSQREKESIEQEWSQSMRSNVDALSTLHDLLTIIGISEDKMLDLTDFKKLGDTLKTNVLELKKTIHENHNSYLKQIEIIQQQHEMKVEIFKKELNDEKTKHNETHQNLLREKEIHEEKSKENLQYFNDHRLQMQLKLNEINSFEIKCGNLSEQKKLLVKEVKQLRKKIEEMNQQMDEIKIVNEGLTNAAMFLKQQIKDLSAAHMNSMDLNSNKMMVNHTEGVMDRSSVDKNNISNHLSTLGNIATQLFATPKQAISVEHPVASVLLVDGQLIAERGVAVLTSNSLVNPVDIINEDKVPDNEDHEFDYSVYGRNSFEGTNAINEDSAHTASNFISTTMNGTSQLTSEKKLLRSSSSKLFNEEKMAVVHDNPLFKTEKKLVDVKPMTSVTSIESIRSTPTSKSDVYIEVDEFKTSYSSSRSGSKYLISGALSFLGANPLMQMNKGTSPIHKTEQDSTATSLGSNKAISNIATPSPTVPKESLQKIQTDFKTIEQSILIPSSHEQSNESSPRMEGMEPKCLRCHGTVAGPLYSTCRCSIPALTSDEVGLLSTSKGMFSSFSLFNSSTHRGSVEKKRTNLSTSFVEGFEKAAGDIINRTAQSAGSILYGYSYSPDSSDDADNIGSKIYANVMDEELCEEGYDFVGNTKSEFDDQIQSSSQTSKFMESSNQFSSYHDRIGEEYNTLITESSVDIGYNRHSDVTVNFDQVYAVEE